MLKSIQGVYRKGKIEIAEVPDDVQDDTPVIVTFLEIKPIFMSILLQKFDCGSRKVFINKEAHTTIWLSAADGIPLSLRVLRRS